MERFQFPSWTNKLVVVLLATVLLGLGYIGAVGAYGTAPGTIQVGYSPKQPVPFSHKLHAGTLKLDCRYCHNTVDRAAHAAVPPTATCVNCHSAASTDGSVPTASVFAKSPKLLPVRESQVSGKPIPWVRVHNLADFVYFNHSAHVNRGVSCVSCHGRVDKMDQVTQVQPLTMAWCLDCHRNPEPNLRPLEYITHLDWQPGEDPAALGAAIRKQLNINPSISCSTCHR
jgi:menaquinone reductase, multiheme cytochrome c subunit